MIESKSVICPALFLHNILGCTYIYLIQYVVVVEMTKLYLEKREIKLPLGLKQTANPDVCVMQVETAERSTWKDRSSRGP